VSIKNNPKKWRAPDLGMRLAALRAKHGHTLKELEQLTDIPASTLSKVQNQQATLSYENLVKLANGLGIEVSELFSEKAIDIKTGRRAITHSGEGLREATDRYSFELLCAELSNKRMNPGIMEISAKTLEEAGGLSRHEGEEFVYVLSGTVEIHSEDYRPIQLEEGDSLYLDSTSGHAYVNLHEKPSTLLAVTTHMTDDLAHLSS